MKVTLKNLCPEMLSTLKRLESKLNFTICDDGLVINVEKGDALYVKCENNIGYIGFTHTTSFFRMFTIFLKEIKKSDNFYVEEKAYFDTCGPMLDMSRNAVIRVESAKEYLDYIAMMGLNQFMLYMEDTYEIKEYPYFGYLRGRFTPDELKEIDDYAYAYGITVIPSIQVLAHLEKYLQWREPEFERDTDKCLLVGYEGTYKLIEAMISTISKCFRTNKVHVGMDEAWDLGAGRYHSLNGIKERKDIFLEHFKRVKEIANKYSVEMMFWSDMFFRLMSKTNDYNAEIDEETLKEYSTLLEGTNPVYWRYNSADYNHYNKVMNQHKEFSDNVSFAGGLHTWEGFVEDLKNSNIRSEAALRSCKDNNFKDVFATAWGNDGAECDEFSSLAGLQYYAEHMYNDDNILERTKENFEHITGAPYDAFLLMSDFYKIFDGRAYEKHYMTYLGKAIFYQDLLMSNVHTFIRDDGRQAHYERCYNEMKEYKSDSPFWQRRLDFATLLFEYLSVKCKVSDMLYPAYKSGDKNTLKEIADVYIDKLYEMLEKFKEAHIGLWTTTNKVFGSETLDIRHSSSLARLLTAKKKINMYLAGEVDKIEELEDERLMYSKRHMSSFSGVVTHGIL